MANPSRQIGRSNDLAIRGITYQTETAVTKPDGHVDVDSDELYLDSDVSADNELWHQIAKNFAIKPGFDCQNLSHGLRKKSSA